MLEVQKYLQTSNPFKLQEDFGIETTISSCKRYGIFNYCMIKSTQKYHPIVKECRGLCLELSTGNVVAKAFDRFYNIGEDIEGQKLFNWNDFVTQEKIDGSLLKFSYYNNQWNCQTRASFAEGFVNDSGFTWKTLFFPLLHNLDEIPKNLTLVCEGVSLYNKTVTHYPDSPKLYLLTVFNNDTLEELGVGVADLFAETLCVSRPKVFHFNNQEELQVWLEAHDDKTFEGFVVRDNENRRIKVKKSSYCLLHKLKNNSNLFLTKNILPLVLDGDWEETIIYWPEYRPFVESVAAKVVQIRERLRLTFEENRGIVSQKDFALAIANEPLRSILFQARKTGNFESAFSASGELLLKVL